MTRFLAVEVVFAVIGVTLVLFGGLGLLAQQLPVAVFCVGYGGALLVAVARSYWRRCRAEALPADAPIFDDPSRPLVVNTRRVLAIVLACLAGIGSLAVGFLLGMELHVPKPLWLACLCCAGIGAWTAWRLLRFRPLLRLDASGIQLPRLGRVAWRAIEGIRVSGPAGRQDTVLVLRLDRPEWYAPRLPYLARNRLLQTGNYTQALDLTDAEPLRVFEAATRWRRATDPVFLSCWEGRSPLEVSVMAVLAKTADSGLPSRKRLADLLDAMNGGWSHLDTRAMGDERLRLARARSERLARMDADHARRMDAAIAAGIDGAELVAMVQQMAVEVREAMDGGASDRAAAAALAQRTRRKARERF